MKTSGIRAPLPWFAAAILAISGQAAGQVETDPAIASWYLNLDGKTGQSPDAAIDSVVSAIDADVQVVSYDATNVYVESTGVPSHPVGPFNDGNPAVPVDMAWLVRVPRTPPSEDPIHPETPLGTIGLFVNGVAVYNMSDAQSWENEGYWNNNAIVVRAAGFDAALGHPSPLTMGPPPPSVPKQYEAFVHEHPASGLGPNHTHARAGSVRVVVDGEYHYHQQSPALREQLGDDGTRHSPVLGYAFDGIPIYGPYGYANPDGSGGTVRIASGYRLRDIAQRTTLPDGTVLAANFHGPAVSEAYPLGYFMEDFEYVSGLGDLDEFNGRFAVTPDYPGGVYAYYATIDENGDSAYPYLLGLSFYGMPLMDNMMGTVVKPGGLTSYGIADEAQALLDAIEAEPEAPAELVFEDAAGLLPGLTLAQFAILDVDGGHTVNIAELIVRGAVSSGPPVDVWVDFQNGSPDQDGTAENPYDTIAEADATVSHEGGGTIHIFGPGATAERPTLSQAVTVVVEGGVVRIGQ